MSKSPLDLLFDVLAYIGQGLLALVVVIKFCDIILRYFFRAPLAWDVEVAEYILLLVTVLGAAWLLRDEGHVSVELLMGQLSERGRTYLRLIHAGVGAFVSVIVFLSALLATAFAQRDGLQIIKVFTVDKFYFLLVIAVGYLLLLAEFLRQFRRHLATLRGSRGGH